MKMALFDETKVTRRANDDTWKCSERVGHLKLPMVVSGISQGKRKTMDFNGGREDMTKKKKKDV
jgi:hypothetical protein